MLKGPMSVREFALGLLALPPETQALLVTVDDGHELVTPLSLGAVSDDPDLIRGVVVRDNLPLTPGEVFVLGWAAP